MRYEANNKGFRYLFADYKNWGSVPSPSRCPRSRFQAGSWGCCGARGSVTSPTPQERLPLPLVLQLWRSSLKMSSLSLPTSPSPGRSNPGLLYEIISFFCRMCVTVWETIYLASAQLSETVLTERKQTAVLFSEGGVLWPLLSLWCRHHVGALTLTFILVN